MAIPGTLEHEGPTAVAQAKIDEIPTLGHVVPWLSLQALDDPEGAQTVVIDSISVEDVWAESGYEPKGLWFSGAAVDTDPIAEDLATYGLDLYDQGSGKWYVFLPSDREAT